MPERKGQFIVNHLRFKLKVPDERIGGYLFAMHDEEFAKLELEYHNYIIPYIHGVKSRDEEVEQVAAQTKMVMDMMEADRKCELCQKAVKYGEDHVSLRSRDEMWHLACNQRVEKNG
jgi:hypothetical protein